MWKNEVELDGPQMAKWRVRFACCITKATNTLRICILIAFPWQQWLHERASILICLVLSRSIEDEG
jgi:hypothetical protein